MRLPFWRLLQYPTKSLRQCSSHPYSVETSYHLPVMVAECCDFLNVTKGRIYVDCTLGGGGHAEAILLKGGKVIGIDQDDDAIRHTTARLVSHIENGQLDIVNSNFRNILEAVNQSKLWADVAGPKLVDGVFFDLGVSSWQIDTRTRGFSYMHDGPLDMRMSGCSSGQMSAETIVNEYSLEAIADILYRYGDERKSRQIAREIVSSRPLHSTKELSTVIERITPSNHRMATLSRCFQALRIAVNDEMAALRQALADIQKIAKVGGRLVVLSYHSLEDKQVKELCRDAKVGHKNKYLSHSTSEATAKSRSLGWRSLLKRPLTASSLEISSNRRARSAKLRAAELSVY